MELKNVNEESNKDYPKIEDVGEKELKRNMSSKWKILGVSALVLALIGVGVADVNNVRKQRDMETISLIDVATFNEKWQANVGENKTADEVMNIMALVIEHNSAEEVNGTNRFISINENSKSANTEILTTKPTITGVTKLRTNTRYTVVAGYSPKTALITGMAYHANDEE